MRYAGKLITLTKKEWSYSPCRRQEEEVDSKKTDRPVDRSSTPSVSPWEHESRDDDGQRVEMTTSVEPSRVELGLTDMVYGTVYSMVEVEAEVECGSRNSLPVEVSRVT